MSMLDEISERKTLYEAFERVRENAGCCGADGVTVGQFAACLETEIDHLQDRVLRRCYHPFPLLRLEIPKRRTGLRSLSIPTVRDRVLQSAVYLVTRGLFEAEFEECSYAYREGRSVKDAVHRVDELRRQGFRWVVDADISSSTGRRRGRPLSTKASNFSARFSSVPRSISLLTGPKRNGRLFTFRRLWTC
jgi:RNA-directed DNA polymerase